MPVFKHQLIALRTAFISLQAIVAFTVNTQTQMSHHWQMVHLSFGWLLRWDKEIFFGGIEILTKYFYSVSVITVPNNSR